MQWSVFERELRDDQLQRLRLSRLIVSEQDSVRFWPVPQRSCAQSLHLGRTLPSPEWKDRVI